MFKITSILSLTLAAGISIVATSPNAVRAGVAGGQDVSLSIRVYEGTTFYLEQEPTSKPWIDGGEDTYVVRVTNDGPETQMIRFGYTTGSVPGPFTDHETRIIHVSGSGYHDDESMRCSVARDYCDVILQGSASQELFLWITADQPGTSFVKAKVIDTELADPEPSNDVAVRKRASTCSIAGTAGDDRLQSTGSHEWICGGPGADEIEAGEGDLIFGGKGKDSMVADKFNQKFFGGSGSDTISFEDSQGPITIDWQSQSPYVIGGSGRDLLFDIERINGSRGDDYFKAAGAEDVFWGRGGDDSFWGLKGDDTAYGGRGDDRFRVIGDGSDFIWGGPGKDRAAVDASDETHSVTRQKAVSLSH